MRRSNRNRNVNCEKKTNLRIDLRSQRLKASQNGWYPVKVIDSFSIDGEEYYKIHYVGYAKTIDEIRRKSELVISEEQTKPGKIK